MEERTILKNKRLYASLSIVFFSILLCSFYSLKTNGQESVYTSPTTLFEVDSNTNFTVYSTAPLTWRLNSPVNFTAYINATGLPAGMNLTVVSISIVYNKPDDPHGEYPKILTPNKNMTVEKELLEQKTLLYAPSDADQFNISLEIVVRSTTSPDNQLFKSEFPGDVEYIEVKKDIVLPIINLPGFPDANTFLRWIFIFGVAFVLISMPSIFVLSFKIKERVENRKAKGGKKK